MRPQVLLVGSLAFDVLFSIPHDFRKSIPVENGDIRSFNASYIAHKKHEFPGGNAGNIAFWLGEKNITSSIFSAWGKDLHQKGYKEKLAKRGAHLRGTEGEFTAHAYMISDPLHQQLIIWQPNAYDQNEQQSLFDFFSIEELRSFSYAVFSAGTPMSIQKHIEEFRSINQSATVLFDPGQVSPLFEKKVFENCVKQSNILIGNNIEFQHFKSFALPDEILTIETFGANGVRITENGNTVHIPAQKNVKVQETTGAGDAFRAGLLTGLIEGKTLEKATKDGCMLGARCVELPSAQY